LHVAATTHSCFIYMRWNYDNRISSFVLLIYNVCTYIHNVWLSHVNVIAIQYQTLMPYWTGEGNNNNNNEKVASKLNPGGTLSCELTSTTNIGEMGNFWNFYKTLDLVLLTSVQNSPPAPLHTTHIYWLCSSRNRADWRCYFFCVPLWLCISCSCFCFCFALFFCAILHFLYAIKDTFK
jgi:hypothetical protein